MQHINSFHKGIVRGVDYTISPQDSYLYMLNGLIISRDDKGFVVTPVKGTTSIAQFSALEAPIGTVEHAGILYIITHKLIDTEAYICFYSYKGSDGDGWIDSMEIIPNGPNKSQDVNGLMIPAELLGYGSDRLLQVFAKESYDSSVDLYICDGLNPNAVVNTGIDKYGKSTDRQYEKFESPIQFALHKGITKAPDVNIEIKEQGNLKPGTYYFYIRYEDDTMNTTPFIKEVGPVIIHAGSSERNNAVGITYETDERVSKSIMLRVSDADPLYKNLSVGVVFYFGADGILSRENFLIDKSYALKDRSTIIVFHGDNPLRILTTEEILADNISYNISKTHIQLDNRMYGANWKGSTIDYSRLQEMALKIFPRAVLDEEDSFDKVHDENNTKMEYMEEEIYPFGVSFLIDGQYKTPVFPIGGWMEGYIEDEVLTVLEYPGIELMGINTIGTMSAKAHVQVKGRGDVNMQEFGVIWSENYSFDWDSKKGYDSRTELGTHFDLIIDGLDIDTTYYVKPYAKIDDEYVYYNQQSFTTKNITDTLSNIIVEHVSPYGFAAYVNRLYVTETPMISKGFIISMSDTPDILTDNIESGQYLSGTLSLNYIASSNPLLYPEVYIQAFIEFGHKTIYSDVKKITFSNAQRNISIDLYVLSEDEIGVKGDLVIMPIETVSERGFLLSKTDDVNFEGATYDKKKTVIGNGLKFVLFDEDIDPDTDYYLRAYAELAGSGLVLQTDVLHVKTNTIESRATGLILHSVDYANRVMTWNTGWYNNNHNVLSAFGLVVSTVNDNPTIEDDVYQISPYSVVDEEQYTYGLIDVDKKYPLETTIYIRAFAIIHGTNEVVYGNEIKTFVYEAELYEMSLNPIDNSCYNKFYNDYIRKYQASINMNVNPSAIGLDIVEAGIVYKIEQSFSSTPDKYVLEGTKLSDTHYVEGTGYISGILTMDISDMAYWIKGYVITSLGEIFYTPYIDDDYPVIIYANDDPVRPIFKLLDLSPYSNSVDVHVIYHNIYHFYVEEKGIIYSDEAYPTWDSKSGYKVVEGNQDEYTTLVEGLESSTQYYFRAYVKINGSYYISNVLSTTTV